MATGDDTEEPFANVVLDADFVREARRRELSARERRDRTERERAERERLASVKRNDRRKQRINRRAVRAIRGGRFRPAVTLVVVGALLGYAAFWGPSREQAVLWASGLPVTQTVSAGEERPTPRPPPSAVPLRQPAARTAPGAMYSFMALRPGSSVPITYDPCRPIPVVVNPRTAPPAGQRLVTEALAEVGAQAGLEFRYERPVSEVPVHPRRPFQPEIYGDRWAPVLIAWSDPTESPDLADRVAGWGGSTAFPVSDRESVYVTGTVTLDGPQFTEILSQDSGFASARAVLLHELGHLIGLSHVADVQQLMHEENSTGVTSFAAGDLSGIAALRSTARCHAAL
ncbi:MAG TPA: matrixin family metalloprotease [Acidimicrobiales bacterium]|nr:matrixin family metalloprotease [Acidimicrobiales bacterium]